MIDPALQEQLAFGRPDEETEAVMLLQPGHDAPPPARAVARFGDVVTCRLAVNDIVRVRSHPSVLALKASRVYGGTEVVVGEPEVGPFPGEEDRRGAWEATGKGVVLAVLDWGCDFAHPNFLRDDGRTRLLALWDQRRPARHPGHRYGYGTLYQAHEIDRALASADPYAALGYHPAEADPSGRGTHGTHVMDIAAGNGRLAGSPVGMAPEADLIFVHLAARGTPLLGDLGGSAPVLEAIDYVRRTAGRRPWVVNMSLGRTGGDHTGLSLVERAIDHVLEEEPGRACVLSAGNYFARNLHAEGVLRPAGRAVLDWRVEPDDRTPNELEVWYSGRDRYRVRLRAPDGQVFAAGLDQSRSVRVDGREVGRLYHRAGDSATGDHHVDLFLDAGARAGCWQVTLEGLDVVDGRYHAWIERDVSRAVQSSFPPRQASPRSTIGTIANGYRTLVVGAYDPATGELGAFSSSGPTRDGRDTPHLIAKGVDILAARSTPRGMTPGQGGLVRMSGTSMATPHVAGATALLFQAAGRPLRIQETRALLLGNASDFEADDPPRAGAGRLDVERALAAAVKARNAPRKEGRTAMPTRTTAVRSLEGTSHTPDSLYREVITGSMAGLPGVQVVARPGESLSALTLENGHDLVLVRVAPGEPGLGYAATLASTELAFPQQLAAQGVSVEEGPPGRYAVVVEGGAPLGPPRARLITDASGVVPPGQVLLRVRRPQAQEPAPEEVADEAADSEDEPEHNRDGSTAESAGDAMDEAEARPHHIDVARIRRLAAGEIADHEAASAFPDDEGEAAGGSPSTLPFLLAGPIVRRADPSVVWFWFACREEVTRCTPRLTVYEKDGTVADRLTDAEGQYRLQAPEWHVTRLGERLWIVLAAARPKADSFPVDWRYGYDLEIEHKTASGKATTKLSSLGLDITYRPYKLPTFFIARGDQRLAHGSCRRPGAHGQDAFPVFDRWLGAQVGDIAKRPSALFLTGDQIYADDVALPLFKAVQKLAGHLCGYVESLPRDGKAPISADHYLYWARTDVVPENTRKALTSRGRSPIGFTTEDGEGHLLSFGEYAAMYLLVWNPELCRAYGVDDGSDVKLKGFTAAVGAARRVLANMATYMLFDDHDITDDWNLDADWEGATRNPMAQRIIANGLAAYWAFQGWGNDPGAYGSPFLAAVTRHLEALRLSKGQPGQAAGDFDRTLLSRHWSFVAPTLPPALCVDIRTRRETPKGRTAVLSGPRVWPVLRKLAQEHKLKKGDPLLIVLPTPLLPHRSLMWAQDHEYDWPRDRYQGDYEFYGNNPGQRAELILFLRHLLSPPALIVFSGDVHHGSVIDGLYVHGRTLDAVYQGRGDWAMRVAQVTSSPIKNVKSDVYETKHGVGGLGTDKGNAGESLVPQFENQYATTTENTVLALRADALALKGPLGRQTYIFENHLCVVGIPKTDVGTLDVLFVGVKHGGLAMATTSMSLKSKPSSFRPPWAGWMPREAESDDPVEEATALVSAAD